MEKYITGLYSFNDRFTRLQFVGYSLLNLAISSILGLPLWLLSQTTNPGVAVLAAIGIIVVLGAGAWSNYAIMSKRLHDLGHGAINCIWIALLDIGSSLMEKVSPVLSMLFALSLIGVMCYLVLKPGEIYHNRYGDSTI